MIEQVSAAFERVSEDVKSWKSDLVDDEFSRSTPLDTWHRMCNIRDLYFPKCCNHPPS